MYWQLIHEIRNYYGQEVALYFVFVKHFIICLKPTAIVGAIVFVLWWQGVGIALGIKFGLVQQV